MCACDAEGPSCFRTEVRRARVAHRCVECWCSIRPGERYQHNSGVWDGRGSHFAMCIDCAAFLQAWHAWLESLPSNVRPSDCYQIRSLGEAIAYSLEEHAERVAYHAREQRWREMGLRV